MVWVNVAENTVKNMIKQINKLKAQLVIFGITFKENCPDVRIRKCRYNRELENTE